MKESTILTIAAVAELGKEESAASDDDDDEEEEALASIQCFPSLTIDSRR